MLRPAAASLSPSCSPSCPCGRCHRDARGLRRTALPPVAAAGSGRSPERRRSTRIPSSGTSAFQPGPPASRRGASSGGGRRRRDCRLPAVARVGERLAGTTGAGRRGPRLPRRGPQGVWTQVGRRRCPQPRLAPVHTDGRAAGGPVAAVDVQPVEERPACPARYTPSSSARPSAAPDVARSRRPRRPPADRWSRMQRGRG